MKIIDPHLHLFALEQGAYHWLKAEQAPFWPDKSLINRTFTDADLSLKPPLELVAYIHIEAGFDNVRPWRELATLEQSNSKPFRAIANIDLTATSANFKQALHKLVKLNSFVGVRHILDEQALGLLTNKQVLSNINLLNEMAKNTRLIFETQLTLCAPAPIKALSQVISHNPNLYFIVNHAGFPPIDNKSLEWQHWQNNLLQLAKFERVVMKCSGWEMVARTYPLNWVSTILTVIFKVFGEKRMMLASNFPLCLFSHSSYQNYWQAMISSDFFQQLTKQEKRALCYDNALHYYQLG